jgi:hypothetical protein
MTGLNIIGKNKQRVSTILRRSPIDEGSALDKGSECLLIQLLELGSVVDAKGDQTLRVAMIAHAVIPSIHVATVIVREAKLRCEEIMEGIPVFEASSIYAVLLHISWPNAKTLRPREGG